jgi:hypothetical protein
MFGLWTSKPIPLSKRALNWMIQELVNFIRSCKPATDNRLTIHIDLFAYLRWTVLFLVFLEGIFSSVPYVCIRLVQLAWSCKEPWQVFFFFRELVTSVIEQKYDFGQTLLKKSLTGILGRLSEEAKLHYTRHENKNNTLFSVNYMF